MATTSEKLDMLAELEAQKDSIRAQHEEITNSLIPPEIKAAIDANDISYLAAIDAITMQASALETEIRAEVLKIGKTQPGKYYMAVWSKGRAGGWDSGKLDGFAMAHPEILAAKKPDGEPTVSIRPVK
jgi:hypothetical protein